MTRRLFGTDGVRGVVGESLTGDLVRQLGTAYARWAGGPTVLIGRDTRGSGRALVDALAAGISEGGGDAVDGGVLPTAAVALLAESHGAVVSASHNPPEHNGVKFFQAGGLKLADRDEAEIEALLGQAPRGSGSTRVVEGLGDVYVDTVCARFGAPLQGLRVVCDCANGALAGLAPEALARVGADVLAVGDAPDGSNINVGCGATDPALLAAAVREGSFDIGLAFDGDGDRLVAVDADGQIVDGDQIVAVLALHLGVSVVAVTILTNAGFHELMDERGVRVVSTDVGDRYVVEALRREGGVLGGEQSGHIILLDRHCTGDGLAAGLLLCGVMVASGTGLADLVAVMPKWSQLKENLPVRSRTIPPELAAAIEKLNAENEGRARVLVRPSGTEQVVRLMVESRDPALARALLTDAVGLVETKLG